MDKIIPLGPFDLTAPLGEGGMSQVWRGHHREQGVPVAVKVMREQIGLQIHLRQAFLREAQSVARLLHPGIIRIFDYGQVQEQTAALSRGTLPAGAPYIAMELATRGSLGELKGAFHWRQLRWLLLEILNALAHAHARSIIHRDLKPDNILMTATPEGHTCLKLTDFGIVHFSDPDVTTSTSDLQTLFAGTPYYMSPEQLRGKWREFGPWTDLYSLGCVAYEACCGRLPYEGENLFEIAHQQMASDVPALTPRAQVPEGFEAWVKRMMQKNPRDRFQRAADAAWALIKLPDPPEDSDVFTSAETPTEVRRTRRSTLSDITWVLEDNPLHTTQNTIHSDLAQALAQRLPSPGPDRTSRDRYRDSPPLPETWSRRQPPPPSIQLMGAGLGLYGLREIPYVSRERERTAIWQQLCAVHQHQRPHACVIRGQTGIGKSRLASWIHERAHEVGGAIVLTTTHAQDSPADSGLARMVARALNCAGLARPKVYARVLETLSASSRDKASAELDALALTELIVPGEDALSPEGPRVLLHSTRERALALIRLLEHLCRERPAILWFDDLHWSLDSIECVRLLLTEPASAKLPLLILMALNDDVQHTIPKQHIDLIRQIVEHPHTEELMLRPLHERDQDALIHALLPVEPPLDREVKNLSRGNPMFLVQLIGDWVQNDILEIGEHGYRLKPGASPFLPTTLNQLWNTRLAKLIRTVRRRSPGVSELHVRSVLELTAALGQEILLKEWGVACAQADLSIPAALIPTLVDQGFAHIDHRALSFTHDLLRDQLVRAARQEGRWRSLHRAAASMIDSLYERHTPGAPQRLLYHLLEAQEHALALTPLRYLVSQSLLRGELEQAERYTRQMSELVHELRLPHDHGARGMLALLQALLASHMDGPQLAHHIASRALEAARDYGWQELLGESLLLSAQLHMSLGELGLALSLCREGSELMAERGDHWGLARSFLIFAQLDLLAGRLKEARHYVRDAIELIDVVPAGQDADTQRNLYGLAYHVLGNIHRADQDRDRSTMALQQAQRLFKEVGNLYGLHMIRTQLGHLARDRGDHLVAERFYLDAHAALRDLNHCAVTLPHLSYALSLLDQGRAQDALRMIQENMEHLRETGQRLHMGSAHMARSVALAQLHELDACRLELEQFERWAIGCPLIDLDLARGFERCAAHLEAHGHLPEALQALRISQHHHEALGHREDQERVAQRASALRARQGANPTQPMRAIRTRRDP